MLVENPRSPPRLTSPPWPFIHRYHHHLLIIYYGNTFITYIYIRHEWGVLLSINTTTTTTQPHTHTHVAGLLNRGKYLTASLSWLSDLPTLCSTHRSPVNAIQLQDS